MDQLIGGEVFVVNGDEDNEYSDLFVTDQRVTLDEHLAAINPKITEGLRCFHGILQKASYLPVSFKGKSIFIVCVVQDQLGKGIVVEGADSPAELAKELETLIGAESPFVHGSIEIDNIYLLYGYQLDLGYTINDDDIDEEHILTCECISDELIEIEFKHVEDNNEQKRKSCGAGSIL